jgi:hypothetical protein
MRRDHLIAVAAGTLGALLLVAAWRGSVFGMLLGLMFSPIPLAMATLGLGAVYFPLAVLGGVVAVMVMTGSFELAALYAVVDAAPVAILTRVGAGRDGTKAVDGRVLGLIVVTLGVAAVMVMAAGLVTLPAGPTGLEDTLRGQLQKLMSEVQTTDAVRATFTPAEMAAAMARVLPGAAAWNWAFRALISAVIAQTFLARDGFARWPTPAYRTLSVPGWYVGVFWLAAIVGWLMSGDAGFIAANAAIVLSLPLALQGLAVVHVAVAQFGLGRGGLIVFYGFALVAAGAAIALIVIVGVLENFLQLRARLMRRPRNGGE